jgi:hypothetical protein
MVLLEDLLATCCFCRGQTCDLSGVLILRGSSESKFTEGYFLKNRGLTTDFYDLQFTEENTSY